MTEVNGATNPDIICPSSGEICKVREEVVRLYTPSEANMIFHMRGDGTPLDPRLLDLPEEYSPSNDARKMRLKLAEPDLAAMAVGCTGMQDEICPTRQRMNDSRVRTTAVRGIRRFLRSNKAEEQ